MRNVSREVDISSSFGIGKDPHSDMQNCKIVIARGLDDSTIK